MFSESFDESPDVGSSKKRIAGSRISSRAIFKRLRCPPLINLFNGLPTLRSLFSYNPKSESTLFTLVIICSSSRLSKQSLAL